MSGQTANVQVPSGVTSTDVAPAESGFDRVRLLQPEIMRSPLQYLVSDAGAGVNGQRVLATHRGTALPQGALGSALQASDQGVACRLTQRGIRRMLTPIRVSA